MAAPIDYYLKQIDQEIGNCLRSNVFYTIVFYLMITIEKILSFSIAIISFLIASDNFTSIQIKYLSLSVGIIGIVVSSIQSTVNHLELDVKKVHFYHLRRLYLRFRANIILGDFNGMSYEDIRKILQIKHEKLEKHRIYKYPFFLESKKKIDYI